MKAATQTFHKVHASLNISIHAAREGGDDKPDTKDKLGGISIHAAREGGDAKHIHTDGKRNHFNPRRP